jgi:hypothetical protein
MACGRDPILHVVLLCNLLFVMFVSFSINELVALALDSYQHLRHHSLLATLYLIFCHIFQL